MADATKTNVHRKKKATYYADGIPIPQPEFFVFGKGGHVVNMEKTGNLILGSDQFTLTSPSDIVDIRIGQTVTGEGIPANTTVIAIPDGNSVQLSENATGSFINQTYLFNGLRPEDPTQTRLSQTDPPPYQIPISKKDQEDSYSCTMIGFLGEDEMIGETISEIGLIDTKGDLIAFYHLGPNVKGASEEYEARLKLRE